MSFEVNLSLCLPRDQVSVPVVRHICRFALEEVGVDKPCIADIELALAEACTNVLDHATGETSYEVFVDIEESKCTIRVKDNGAGFDHGSVADASPDAGASAESGRGIGLINALVDTVRFTSVPDAGMIVHLEKLLDFDAEHPVRKALALADPA